MACRGAEAEGQPQARSRRGSAELPVGTTGNKKPAVIDDGGLFWARKRGWRLFWTRYLPDVLMKKRASGALSDHFGGDLAEAGEAEGACGTRGEVEHPATHERAAVVDGDGDGAAAMGHAQLGAERQRAMGAGHGVLVEPLTRGGLAAGLVAVGRGNAGEAVAAAADR